MFLRYLVLELVSSFLKMIRHPRSYRGHCSSSMGERFYFKFTVPYMGGENMEGDGSRRLGKNRVVK